MDGLSTVCEQFLGSPVRSRRPLHGGDLSDVALIVLDDGRMVVAKSGPLVGREGRMLQALAGAGAPVPEVLGQSGDHLLISYLPEGPADPETWPRLGADLARLHAGRAEPYGWPEDYAFGAVAIPNGRLDDWPRFWAERRLLPALPELPPELARRVEALARRLPEFLPRRPEAGLLHGDLWTGNLLIGPGGRAFLIDPACYYGHGEVDLAMLHLFGRPDRGFAEGYGPLDPGWEIRRAIYTLFPALVHLRLFGAGYRRLVAELLTAAGA